MKTQRQSESHVFSLCTPFPHLLCKLTQILVPYIIRCVVPGQCYVMDLQATCSSLRKRGIALGR